MSEMFDVEDGLINKAELWGDNGSFQVEMHPHHEPDLSGIPDDLLQGHVFKMYITCDVRVQADFSTDLKMGTMMGLDLSSVPVSVDFAVKTAREAWRKMFDAYGDEVRSIIEQPRDPAENPDQYPKPMQKLVTAFKLFWGIIKKQS